jgi:hypothetical protein
VIDIHVKKGSITRHTIGWKGKDNVHKSLRTRLAALAELSVGNDGDVLKEGDPDEDLESAAVGDSGVVALEGANTENRVVEISEDPARGGEHSNAAVLELGFAEEEGPLRGLLGELQGIEVLELRAFVTRKSASKGHLHGAGSHTACAFKLVHWKNIDERDTRSYVHF